MNFLKKLKGGRFEAVPQVQGRPHDLPRMMKIFEIQDENAFVKTFVLEGSIGGKPGQFLLMWLPRVDEKPFSIGLDDGKHLTLTVARVGTFTEELFAKQVGDVIGIRGPYGTTFSYEPKERLALLGGGYGSVPLYFLATLAVTQGCTIEFILGARSSSHLLYLERIRSLPRTTLHIATDDGSEGFKGFNVAFLRELLEGGLKIDRMLTVGPEPMMVAVSDLALEKALPCQVSVERYMKCGFGICGQCVLDDLGTPTCIEGPVMDHLKARAHVEFGAYHRDKVGRKKHF